MTANIAPHASETRIPFTLYVSHDAQPTAASIDPELLESRWAKSADISTP
jgi:hypothetical protein